MPFTEVEVPDVGIVEFPEDMPMHEIESELARLYPPDGKDIEERLGQEPDWRPSEEEFALYEKHALAKPTDIMKTGSDVLSGLGDIFGAAAKHALEESKISKGDFGVPKILNPLNAVEGVAQGTRAMGEMLMDSADPSSMQFRTEAFFKRHGTLRDRYNQFLGARQVQARSRRIDAGEETVLVPKEYVDPEIARAIGTVSDVSMVPGLNALAIPGKLARIAALPGHLATKGVGLGVRQTGRLVNAFAKPAERVGAHVGEFVERATGFTADQLKNLGSTAGVAGAVAGIPGAKALIAAPHAISLARGAGDVLEHAGQNLLEQPTRLGPMESLGRIPGATPVQKGIGLAGRLGGDAALDVGLHSVIGAATGAGIGGGLGWWSGGTEGLVGGLVAGSLMGAGMGAGGRVLGRGLGLVKREARHNDLKKFVARQTPDVQNKLNHIISDAGVDATIQMLDGVEMIQGHLGDAKVNWLNDKEFKAKHKGVSARGIEVMEGDIPTIDINVDFPRTPETVGHEIFHVLNRIEQLGPEMSALKRKIVGAFDEKGQRLTDSLLDDAQIEKMFETYRDGATPAEKVELDALKTVAEKAEVVFGEVGGEHMSQLIRGSKPDDLLRGFGGMKRAALDQLLLKHADTLLGRLAAKLGNPGDAVESRLFGKDLPDAPPVVQAMLRDLVRARGKLSERMKLDTTDRGYKRSEPIPASLADELKNAPINLVRRNVDNTYTIRSDAELQGEEKKFNEALKQAVESAPVKDPTKPHMRLVDGRLEGEGFSHEQRAAIDAHPGLNDRTKEMLAHIDKSMRDGTVLRVLYAAASRKTKSGKTRYGTLAITDRDWVPYKIYQNQEGGWVAKGINLTQAAARARDLAKNGNLGPYGSSLKSFLTDFKDYLRNSSNHAGIPTKDFFEGRGDSPADAQAKKEFLHKFFAEVKDHARIVKDYRVDRILSVLPLAENIPVRELAWERMKINWMQGEKVGKKTVISSDEGSRMVQSESGKWKLFDAQGKPVGVFDTQRAAEKRAAAHMPSTSEPGATPGGERIERKGNDFTLHDANGRPLVTAQTPAELDKYTLTPGVPPGRQSTRLPWGEKSTEHPYKGHLIVGLEAGRQDPLYWKKITTTAIEPRIGEIKKQNKPPVPTEMYNFMKGAKGTPEQKLLKFLDFVKNNLLWLHDTYPTEWRERSQLWYDGARRFVQEWSQHYKVSPDAVAAMISVLSPQRHWFHNLHIAKLILDSPAKHGSDIANKKMIDWVHQKWGAVESDPLKGKRFKDLSSNSKGAFLRAYETFYGEPGVRIALPEGEFSGEVMRNKAKEEGVEGEMSGLAWGGLDVLEKAFEAYKDPGRVVLSDLLGKGHKVRNFNNNNLHPNDTAFGDVTADTHHVAASLLEPMSSSDPEVLQNMGGAPGSAHTGNIGTYAIYADATRLAASERDILPRKMQSIPWEAGRSLFEDTKKTDANRLLVKKIWKDYAAGRESIDSARQKIFEIFNGFTKPDWADTQPAGGKGWKPPAYDTGAGGSERGGEPHGSGGHPGDPAKLFATELGRSELRAGGRGGSGDPQGATAAHVEFVPDPTIPGAESASGFRILPSKKGNFRVYAPDGTVIGVQGSQEKARQLVRRKAGAQ